MLYYHIFEENLSSIGELQPAGHEAGMVFPVLILGSLIVPSSTMRGVVSLQFSL